MIIMKKLHTFEKHHKEKLYFFNKCMLLIILFATVLTTAVKSEAATSLNALINKYVGTTWKDSNYKYAKQCKGFAGYIWYQMYGVQNIGPYDANKYYIPKVSGGYEIGRLNFNQMTQAAATSLLKKGQAGDFIQVRRRGKSYGHSMIYVSQDNKGIVVFDCNSDGKNGIKKYHITWSNFYKKNSAMSIYRASNQPPVTPDIVKPTPAPNPNPAPNPYPVPSINSVNINGIDNGSISFSFSVNNGTLAKVVIESTLTGKTKVDSFTSNLSNITYTFNRMSMPTGGNQYHIYLYAYSGSVNNYKNEQVHKMTYGSTRQCVTFPDTISNDQLKILTFNARFYADMYEDVRKAFGYDEKMLYNHWLNEGVKEGRIGCPGYCGSFYLKNNGDIANAYGAKNYVLAFYHYTTYGYKEERQSSPVFSAAYYLNNNGDISHAYGKKNYLEAAIHYNMYGINELRNSSIYYDGQYYKNNNGDLSKMSPYELLLHYYKYGIGERRNANSGNKIPNI